MNVLIYEYLINVSYTSELIQMRDNMSVIVCWLLFVKLLLFLFSLFLMRFIEKENTNGEYS